MIIYVLCNSSGPVAAYTDPDRAAGMLATAEDCDDQQNNYIEEFTANQHPNFSALIA